MAISATSLSDSDYIRHLSKDRVLRKILLGQEPFFLKTQKNIFLSLCRSIIGQQLSTTVARVINQRFLDLFDSAPPTPQALLSMSMERLRSAGLSTAKMNYIRDLAAFTLGQGIDRRKLNKMDDESLVSHLTQIKGVGRWTVEMLMIFTLARPDVFAADDLGIQTAISRLYHLDRSDKKSFHQQIVKLSSKWSPYRTYACLHLWHWRDSGLPEIKN